jgi:hypothetical protein
MAKVRKISDKEFWALLRENAGIYSRTAKAIRKTHGIPYTRQAVKQRAESKPDLLEDIEEENIDIAEEGIHSLMRSRDERIKLRAVEVYLRTKGRKRGYVEKQEMDHTTGGKPFKTITSIEVVYTRKEDLEQQEE